MYAQSETHCLRIGTYAELLKVAAKGDADRPEIRQARTVIAGQ